jgi:CxxC motif-containing protein
MLRTYVCIVCPNGCDLRVEIENGEVSSVAGNRCPRGDVWARGEVSDPLRVVTGSIASVRTSGPVPKNRIFDAVTEIRRITLDAPVPMGDEVVSNLLGLGVSLVVTRDVEARTVVSAK